MDTFELWLESLEKPNFTHAQLFAIEQNIPCTFHRRLLKLMEQRFNLPAFQLDKRIEEQAFNATQIQLAYAGEGLLGPAQCKQIRELLEKNYKLPPLEAETVEQCLEAVSAAERPNFTQYQLRMCELGAASAEWKQLRHVMEKKFSLESLDRFIPVCTAYDCYRPLDAAAGVCKNDDCINPICAECVKMGDVWCERHR
jgi:hypothetical protein